MSEGEMNTIPGRLNEIEQIVHTLAHRMDSLDALNLPHRMGVMELTVEQVKSEVVEMKIIVREISANITSGLTTLAAKHDVQFAELRSQQERSQAFIKGVLWVGAGLVGIMQIAPAISFIIHQMAIVKPVVGG